MSKPKKTIFMKELASYFNTWDFNWFADDNGIVIKQAYGHKIITIDWLELSNLYGRYSDDMDVWIAKMDLFIFSKLYPEKRDN